MNTPVIDSLLASNPEGSSAYTKRDPYNKRMVDNLHAAVKGFEDSITAGKIFNTEFKDGYSSISRAVEEAFNAQAQAPGNHEAFRAAAETWNRETDPRMALWYHPAFANTPGALKRLLKYESDPLVAAFLPVLREAVALLELTKQAKPLIVKGRKPNPNYVPPDMSNTAHCAICGKQQKLAKNQTVVDHGFQISDGVHYFGTRVGHCFGVGYKPYQLSNGANIDFKEYLEKMLKQTEDSLKELNSGSITELHTTKRTRSGFDHKDEPVVLVKGVDEPQFQRELESRIQRAEYQRDTLKSDIKFNDKKIAVWKQQPLPEGQILSIFSGPEFLNLHMK